MFYISPGTEKDVIKHILAKDDFVIFAVLKLKLDAPGLMRLFGSVFLPTFAYIAKVY